MARILPTGLAKPWQYKEKKIVKHTPMTQVGPTELKAIYDVGKTLWDEVISPNMAALIGAIVRANQAEGPDKKDKETEVNRLAAIMKASPKDMAKAKEAASAVAPAPVEAPAEDPAEVPIGDEEVEFEEEDLSEPLGLSEFTSDEKWYWTTKILPKLASRSMNQDAINNFLEVHAKNLKDAGYRPKAFSLAVKTYFDSLQPHAGDSILPDALARAGLVDRDRPDIELEAAQIKYPDLNFSRDPETGAIKTESPLKVGLAIAAPSPGPGFESITGESMSLTGELPAGSPRVGPGIGRSFTPELEVTERYAGDDFTGGFPAPPVPPPPTAVPSSPAAVAREPDRYDNIWAEAAAATTPEEQKDIIQRYVDMYQPRDMGEVIWGDDYRKEAQARRMKEYMTAVSTSKSPALEEKRRLQNIEQAMKNKALERSYGDLTDAEEAELTGAELVFYNKALKARRQQVIIDQEELDLKIDKDFKDRMMAAKTITAEDQVYIRRAKEKRDKERWEIDKAQAHLDATLTKQKIGKLVRDLKDKDIKDLKPRVDYLKAGLRQRAIRITYEIKEMLKLPRVYGTRIAAKTNEHDKVVKEIQSLGKITNDRELRAWIRAH